MSSLVIADRDGTLIEDMHYLSDPQQVSVIPGVLSAIKLFEKSNIDLIVCTNQSGVARGYFDEKSVQLVNSRCQSLIDPDKKILKHFFYCPHGPADKCNCRKPLTGMVKEFLEKNNANYDRIYVVGDRFSDLEFGINVQALPVLVLTGKGNNTRASREFSKIQHLCVVVPSFYDAAKLIGDDNCSNMKSGIN